MKYELMLVLKSSVTDEEEKKIFAQIGKALNSHKLGKPEFIGKKNLAYPIKKEKEGKYWLLEIEGEGKEAHGFFEKLKLEETVLRYLVIRKDSPKQKE